MARIFEKEFILKGADRVKNKASSFSLKDKANNLFIQIFFSLT